MKKIVVLVLSIMLSLSLCAAAETFPSGWYSLRSDDGIELPLFYLPEGSSVTLPDSMTLSPLKTVRPFTAAPGIYSVPSDVPPGIYSVRCDASSSWCIVSVWDGSDDLVISQVMHSDEGGFVGSVPLLDGYTFKVDKGSARFEASVGVSFD